MQGPHQPAAGTGAQPQQFKGWGTQDLAERSPLKPRHAKSVLPDRLRLMPLEFKSGRAHHTHRAQVGANIAGMCVPFPQAGCGSGVNHVRVQVLLYQLLLEQRYGVPVRQGLLWNLKEPVPAAVRTARPYAGRSRSTAAHESSTCWAGRSCVI